MTYICPRCLAHRQFPPVIIALRGGEWLSVREVEARIDPTGETPRSACRRILQELHLLGGLDYDEGAPPKQPARWRLRAGFVMPDLHRMGWRPENNGARYARSFDRGLDR